MKMPTSGNMYIGIPEYGDLRQAARFRCMIGQSLKIPSVYVTRVVFYLDWQGEVATWRML